MSEQFLPFPVCQMVPGSGDQRKPHEQWNGLAGIDFIFYIFFFNPVCPCLEKISPAEQPFNTLQTTSVIQ